MKFWLLFFGILSLCTGTRAECCFIDEERKKCWGVDPDHYTCVTFCRDGKPQEGHWCGKGDCNLFSCDCDGGCIKGDAFDDLDVIKYPYRHPVSVPEDDESSKSTMARCQDQTVKMYNTTVLREQEQILAYYNCLQTVSDGILDTNDAVIQELQNSPNGRALLKAMDSNGNDGIEPGEFDSGLYSDVSQSSGWSNVPSLFEMAVLSGFALFFFTCVTF